MSDEIFEVEEILDERTRRGKSEFLIKWKGYGPEDNTWEREENILCVDMIKEFREQRERKRANAVKSEKAKEEEFDSDSSARRGRKRRGDLDAVDSSSQSKTTKVEKADKAEVKPTSPKKRGFDRGYEPEAIIGATDQVGKDGQVYFLVKW